MGIPIHGLMKNFRQTKIFLAVLGMVLLDEDILPPKGRYAQAASGDGQDSGSWWDDPGFSIS
jgi:hypothetical protein